MSNAQDELKACVFCNGGAEWERQTASSTKPGDLDGDMAYIIRCTQCGTGTTPATKQKALEFWDGAEALKAEVVAMLVKNYHSKNINGHAAHIDAAAQELGKPIKLDEADHEQPL